MAPQKSDASEAERAGVDSGADAGSLVLQSLNGEDPGL